MPESTLNPPRVADRTQLVDLLIHDLKETGEHLRDTDRKVSFVIQLYGGGFLLLATLAVGAWESGIGQATALISVPGLVLLALIFLFTFWLFHFTLKTRSLKKEYISRMNFLRAEAHYFLKNPSLELAGYWTVTKSGRGVGLDDLSPHGLRVVMLLVALFSSYVVSSLAFPACLASRYAPAAAPFIFAAAIFLLLAIPIWAYTQDAWS